MALKVWLPLSGNTTNYGLSEVHCETISSTEQPSIPSYQNSILGGSAIAIGEETFVKASFKMSLSAFTIAFWVKSNIVNPDNSVLFTMRSGNTELMTCIKENNKYYIPQLINYSIGSLFNPDNSGWNFIIIITDGVNIKVYVNGLLTHTAGQVGSINVGNNDTITLIFGGNVVNGGIGQPWTGSICDLRIYDSPISLFEAKALSNALVLHYAFNGNVSFGSAIDSEDYPEGTDAEFYGFTTEDTEYDLSGNGFNGAFGTRKPVTEPSSCIYSSSYNFTSADPITVAINSSEFRTRYTVSIWASGNGEAVRFSNGTAIPVNYDGWHNIVITSDGKKYIDGVDTGTIVSGLIGNNTCNITIGGEAYNGVLSDFRIYAKQMTASEILALYKRRAAIDNTGKLIANEIVVDDEITSPSFTTTGVVKAADMNNWTGESESPVDVTTFTVLPESSTINASDIIEF